MFKSKLIISFLAVSACVFAVSGQDSKTTTVPSDLVIWEQVDIPSRDLYRGPTSDGIAPALDRVTFLGRQPGGTSPKYRIRDANDREWVVKISEESQAEVAAVRLVWALGFRTEIDQIVPRISIQKIGNFKNARFEARPESIKRGDRWSWANNPYEGTREFDGLKIMMAFINNWDLKDENNLIVTEGGKSYMMVSDLGSSFGKLADKPQSRSGRSRNEPKDFANANFVKEVKDGIVVLDYRGMADNVMTGIKLEHARWVADMLLQLTDRQIADAFRAANYSGEDIALLAAGVKRRIAALDKATRPEVAEVSQ